MNPRFNQAAWAVAARCGAHSCCAWRAVIWSFAQGERQELTETLSSLKTSSFFKKGRFGGVDFLFLEPNWLKAQRISRRNTPTSVCFGRWHVLLPLGDVQVLDWLIGIPHDTTTCKARMIHKKKSERWKGIEISISLRMLQTLWPENTWDLHNLQNLGQIIAEDLCQSISQTFRSFLHPDFLQFLVSHRFCPSSDRCDLRGTLHSTKGQSHLRIASQSISQILRSPGTIPESLQFVTLDETAPRNWNSQKENKQTKIWGFNELTFLHSFGIGLNLRFLSSCSR